MNKIYFALAFAILLTTSQSHAARKTYTALASPSCKDWMDARSERKKIDPLSPRTLSTTREFWLLGLMTGMNALYTDEVDLLKAVNSTLIYDWMDRFCNEHPTKDVLDGAFRLMKELEKNASKR